MTIKPLCSLSPTSIHRYPYGLHLPRTEDLHAGRKAREIPQFTQKNIIKMHKKHPTWINGVGNKICMGSINLD